MPALHQTRRLINAEDKLCCKKYLLLFFYTLHRNEIGVNGAERQICCIVIVVLRLH